MTGVAGIRPDVDVVLGVRHKVHPAQVGRLESCLEGEMALLSLASVAGGPDHQPGDVGLTALVLTVAVPHPLRFTSSLRNLSKSLFSRSLYSYLK